MTVRKKGSVYEARLMIDYKTFSACGKTKKEAVEKLNAKVMQHDEISVKSLREKQVKKVSTWIREFMKMYKSNLKPATLKCYNSMINTHLLPSIGHLFLSEITPVDIQTLINGIKAPRSRQLTYIVLKQIFDKAYKLDFIQTDLMKVIERPKHRQVVGMALTKEELASFFEKIKGDRTELYFYFLVYTGARRSEAVKVTWEDIDFDKSKIKINGTKTDNSKRVIPLFEPLKNKLYSNRKYSGLMFKFTADYATKKFKSLCPEHRLHDLRHTFATVCLEYKINIAVISKWLGHSNIETTLNIYTHVLEDFQETEIQKFKKIL